MDNKTNLVYHLPRWNEIPEIDLYIDQVVSLLEKYLEHFIESDNLNDGKLNVLKSPINKKYGREHIASLFVIFILKQIYSIDEIKKLITLAIDTSETEHAYDRFCSELENAINMTFSGDNYLESSKLSKEQYILRNVVQSFANKLYVQKTFLQKS